MPEAAVARARSLDYRPVLAEALTLLGIGQANLGEFPRAEETLTQAVLAALAGGHDRAVLPGRPRRRSPREPRPNATT